MTKVFCIAYVLLLYLTANPILLQPVQAEVRLIPINIEQESEPECSDSNNDGECDAQPPQD